MLASLFVAAAAFNSGIPGASDWLVIGSSFALSAATLVLWLSNRRKPKAIKTEMVRFHVHGMT
jgi:hypothetical protein